MQHAAALVSNVGAQQEQAGAISGKVKNLFLMLQGSYGAAFLSKYSTGVKDREGRDLGIRASMKVWQTRLDKYPDDVLTIAFNRVTVECPEFPPSLPQLEKACEAAMPRKTYAQEQGFPPALPAPAPVAAPVHVELRKDGKDWARKILAEAKAGHSMLPIRLRFAREALGMEGKQSWQ